MLAVFSFVLVLFFLVVFSVQFNSYGHINIYRDCPYYLIESIHGLPSEFHTIHKASSSKHLAGREAVSHVSQGNELETMLICYI